MATKVTLPKMSQLETPYVTDREISTGAWATKRKVDGKEVNAGDAFSSVADDSGNMQAREYNGGGIFGRAGFGGFVVRPRFEKQSPNSFKSDTNAGIIEEKDFDISNGALCVDGKPVYWGAEKIDISEELGNIDLKLPSNKNAGDGHGFDQKKNKQFELQENQCVIVKLADGTIDYAEKIVGVIRGDNFTLVYNDGTDVKDGGTAYHRLRPMPAKEIDGGIQTGAGMATRFDTQDHYESKKHKNGDKLDISKYDVGKAITAMTTAFVKSAEVMATLSKANTVSGLFDLLRAGTIDENNLQAGIIAITKEARKKEGATVEDVQALNEKIKQASLTYARRNVQQEQERER